MDKTKQTVYVGFEIDKERDPEEFLRKVADNCCGEYRALKVGDRLWLVVSGFGLEIIEKVVYRYDKLAALAMHDFARINRRRHRLY